MAYAKLSAIQPILKEVYGRGKPKTEAERRKRHFARFGTKKLPPRGTGQGK